MAAPVDVRKNRVQLSDSSPGFFSRAVAAIVDFLWRETNFFRLHVSAFVLVPLVLSGIFYASNGRFHIRYIDSLFLCYSAMTDTGLTTVNLSTLTAWQQVLLYLLLMLVSFHHESRYKNLLIPKGDTTFISWLMVMTRK